MAKFFKWFCFCLVFVLFAPIFLNLFSITRSYDYQKKVLDEGNTITEEYKEYIDFNVFNWYSTGLKDVVNSYRSWQEENFLPGFHDVSVKLAESFFPDAYNNIDSNGDLCAIGFRPVLWIFMYNLLPCVVIITCFGTIAWIFKLWN